MGTVDLTKVAGFKAVDAEGNDMGVVSLSEITNMVKEEIIQEAVAMQSVSTLAETSTPAATDTYEDKLDISDTFSYVRTLDSNGNPKRTSQNALATVVGGLLGNPLGDKGSLSSSENFDNIVEPGIYAIGAGNPGIPNSSQATMMVIRNSYKYITQIRFNSNGYINIRTKVTEGNFPSWSTHKPI